MSRDHKQTDDLIADLVASARAVPENAMTQRLAISLGLGVAAAVLLQSQTAGFRDDALVMWPFVAEKLAACVVMAAVWFWLLRKLAAPGTTYRLQKSAALGTLAVAACIAAFAPSFELAALKGCVSQVLLLAVPAFIAIVFALRASAPTHLTEAGFAAGIVAGALGAVGYSLGCTADDATIVAFRYGTAVLACGLLGALAGRFVLRW